MTQYHVLAHHRRWVYAANITESISTDSTHRRFTATIDGWRGWLIWEGKMDNFPGTERIIQCVKALRDRVMANEKAVFTEKGPFMKEEAQP